MKPAATIDTSCIIALDLLNLIPQTASLFSRLLLPKAVREELFRRRKTKDRLQGMIEEYGFLERCDAYSRQALDIVFGEQLTTDRGEAEAVVRAAPLGAMVVVDDPLGRQLAESFGLETHGTLWILEQLHRLEYLNSSVLREHLVTLRLNKIRLPHVAMNELLRSIGERPI